MRFQKAKPGLASNSPSSAAAVAGGQRLGSGDDLVSSMSTTIITTLTGDQKLNEQWQKVAWRGGARYVSVER